MITPISSVEANVSFLYRTLINHGFFLLANLCSNKTITLQSSPVSIYGKNIVDAIW